MANTTKVNFQAGTQKLRALARDVNEPMRDVLKSWARLAAIQCAKFAAPPGVGYEAQQTGERAVRRDINKVYGDAGQAYQRLTGRVKGAFWSAYKRNDFIKAESLLETSGLHVGTFDGGSAHKIARNARGRVAQHSPSFYIIRSAERRKLERYIKEEMSHVGTGKGGWADVARQIGSIRGLRGEGDITANWITRKSHGLGAVAQGGTEQKPTITITNRVPYADQILDTSGKRLAFFTGRERALQNLKTRIRYRRR